MRVSTLLVKTAVAHHTRVVNLTTSASDAMELECLVIVEVVRFSEGSGTLSGADLDLPAHT